MEIEALRVKLNENLALLALSPDLSKVAAHDVNVISEQIETASKIRGAVISIGTTGEEISQSLQMLLSTSDQSRRDSAALCCRWAKKFQEAWEAYSHHCGTTPVSKDSTSLVSDAGKQANSILSRRTMLKHWTAWVAVRNRADQLGLKSFVEALQSGSLNANDALARFQLAYARWWLPIVVDQSKQLRTFQKFLHEEAIEEFRTLDDLAREAAAPRTRQALRHDLPSSEQVPRKSELGLLRHQMSLKRPSKSIREMISGMPETFGKLAPCLLMSPLSIAQYLPPDQALFDVVVFDEASQIATWDAIGAIARGKQTIIVGDPKQLPPTNFFGKAENDEDNPELEHHEKDLESILDEARASGLPTLQLNWHYRSKHESLLAFSNWNYYGNRLVTFPAAESADRGVSLKHVAGAIYDRGKSRTNRQEAEVIVADVVVRMMRCLNKPENQRLTYGIITFNTQQQGLIQDLLDEAQRQKPALEWFFSEDRIEPTVVKNLENVQGDERDVMLLSITFGVDAAGKFSVDFGAINRDGGERRLNVAITRARQELVVYTSFMPEQFRAERSTARGIRDLKSFLEYAEKGPKAMTARIEGSLGGCESPLEEAVAGALEECGWQVDTQVGISGFRIDLGIVHPDKPGAYLAGVECDGAAYHRSAVARDRDKIRQQVLENLGWKIVRVWSTDWWYDSKMAIAKIDKALRELLQQNRDRLSVVSSFAPLEDFSCDVEAQSVIDAEKLDLDCELRVALGSDAGAPATTLESGVMEPTQQLIAKQGVENRNRVYIRVNLGDVRANQDRFYDDDYAATLRSMAFQVLETQGPIRDDAMASAIARAHGFGRTTSRIKQRVLELLANVTSTQESVGTFLWPGASAQESVPFRYSSDNDDRRSLDEIAIPELIGLLRENPSFLSSDDPVLAMARAIGLARLARTARDRLEEALEAFSNRAVPEF